MAKKATATTTKSAPKANKSEAKAPVEDKSAVAAAAKDTADDKKLDDKSPAEVKPAVVEPPEDTTDASDEKIQDDATVEDLSAHFDVIADLLQGYGITCHVKGEKVEIAAEHIMAFKLQEDGKICVVCIDGQKHILEPK
jgi:hypothetical protein